MELADIVHHTRKESQIDFVNLLHARSIRLSQLMESVKLVHMALIYHLIKEIVSRLVAQVHDNIMIKVFASIVQITQDQLVVVVIHSTLIVNLISAHLIRFKKLMEVAEIVLHTR